MFKRKAKSVQDPTPNKKPTATSTTASTSSSSSSSSEPWKLVFQDARQAFGENKFKEALALFSRALSLQPNQTTLLDCRAATYEKLNELDLAYKDAASMVKVAPKDARGYLRAGKVLSLQKKYDRAILIYTRALKQVDHNDNRYAMITNMKEAAEKASKPPPKHDMMTRLPYDVISLIFSHLSFDRRIQCSAVSKSWRNFAVNWSGMWRDLEFGQRKVSMNIIKRYLGYAQGRHVRSFSIHYANRNMMKNVLQLLIDENCQYVETLDLKGCEIPVDVFARMLRLVGKHVKHLRLDHSSLSASELLDYVIPICPSLTQLSILGLVEGRPYAKEEYPPLDHLTYLRCNSLGHKVLLLSKNLTALDFYSSTIYFFQLYNEIVNTHKRLHTVYFSYGHNAEKLAWNPQRTLVNDSDGIKTFGIYDDRFFKSDVLTSFLIENPKLGELAILGCDLQAATGLANYIQSHGKVVVPLKKLVLQNCHGLTEEALHTIVTHCTLLEQVHLPKLTVVMDTTLNQLAAYTQKLRILDISDCTQVTGVGLQALVRAHGSHLEKLVLNNCQRIGPDAVNWAVSQLGRRVVECKFRVK